MKAWQFTETDAPLSLNEVVAPEPAANEVVLDVKAAGLCHSDVGFIDGTLTALLPFRPITLGHEIAGIVSAVGADVTTFSVGDRAVIPAAIEGPGTSLDGGFAEKVKAPARLVAPLPDGVPFDQAAAATDAGMTSYHAMMVQGGLKPGMKVGVIGLGGLGSLGAQTAIANGAELYVAEINEKVHAMALEIGATAVAKDIRDFADKELDLVVDFAGFGTTTAGAVDIVRRGGRVVQVGLGRSEGTINLQQLTLNEVELVGSQAGTLQDCADVLQLMADGKLSAHISQISFDEIGEGIDKLARGEVIGRLVALID
ncbi:MAG: zinc-binding dehydrogenase [Actinomycetota bacterium]